MKMILFVCTGNTCRSAMAEIVFNDIIKRSKSIGYYADSAGILAHHTNRISQGAYQTLLKNNFQVPDNFQSTLLTKDLLQNSQYVFVMEQMHKGYILEHFPEYHHKYYLLSEIGQQTEEIQDPVYSNRDFYQETFIKIKKYLDILINKIINKERIL